MPRQRRSSFGKMATTTSKLLSYDHIYENFFVHKKKGKKPCRKMTLGKKAIFLSLSLLFRSQFSFFSPLTKNSSMGHNRLKNLIKQATYMFQIYKYVSRISTSISIFGYNKLIGYCGLYTDGKVGKKYALPKKYLLFVWHPQNANRSH